MNNWNGNVSNISYFCVFLWISLPVCIFFSRSLYFQFYWFLSIVCCAHKMLLFYSIPKKWRDLDEKRRMWRMEFLIQPWLDHFMLHVTCGTLRNGSFYIILAIHIHSLNYNFLWHSTYLIGTFHFVPQLHTSFRLIVVLSVIKFLIFFLLLLVPIHNYKGLSSGTVNIHVLWPSFMGGKANRINIPFT